MSRLSLYLLVLSTASAYRPLPLRPAPRSLVLLAHSRPAGSLPPCSPPLPPAATRRGALARVFLPASAALAFATCSSPASAFELPSVALPSFDLDAVGKGASSAAGVVGGVIERNLEPLPDKSEQLAKAAAAAKAAADGGWVDGG